MRAVFSQQHSLGAKSERVRKTVGLFTSVRQPTLHQSDSCSLSIPIATRDRNIDIHLGPSDSCGRIPSPSVECSNLPIWSKADCSQCLQSALGSTALNSLKQPRTTHRLRGNSAGKKFNWYPHPSTQHQAANHRVCGLFSLTPSLCVTLCSSP